MAHAFGKTIRLIRDAKTKLDTALQAEDGEDFARGLEDAANLIRQAIEEDDGTDALDGLPHLRALVTRTD